MARWFVLVISIAWYASMQSFTTEELNSGFMSSTLRTNYFHYFSGTNKLDKISPTAGGSVTPPYAANNRSFTYDKNGNLASDALRDNNFLYDRANLPYRVYNGSTTYAFGYNTADARIFKGNDNQAYYYLAGSVYDMKNDQWEHYPGGLAVHKNGNLNLIIKDHLTNTRAVVSTDNTACSGTTYEAQHDYYPYGKVLRKLESPRSRFQSTDHETDSETGYNNRNARWYDDEAMRFLNVDPMAMKMPQSSPYSYCLGNPIVLVDKDGKIPYPITIRAFAPFQYFGGGFHGDYRGYSIENVSARVHQKINFDTDKSTITTKAWCSPSSHKLNPDYQKTATPSVNFTKDFSITSQNGNRTFDFGSHVKAANPLTPPGTPNIDVYSNFKITENKKTGTLDINVKLTGDNFPSTEAFITDPKGQNVFIGIGFYQGSPLSSLWGENEDNQIDERSLSVILDKDGNFTGVKVGDITYNIDDWNKLFTQEDPHKNAGK